MKAFSYREYDTNQVLRMSPLIQPELVWLAVAFTVLMAGILAAAAE